MVGLTFQTDNVIMFKLRGNAMVIKIVNKAIPTISLKSTKMTFKKLKFKLTHQGRGHVEVKLSIGSCIYSKCHYYYTELYLSTIIFHWRHLSSLQFLFRMML